MSYDQLAASVDVLAQSTTALTEQARTTMVIADAAKDVAIAKADISVAAANAAIASKEAAQVHDASALASRNSATASATAATTKASEAAASAVAALVSQTAAKTSETNAKASEVAAAPAIAAGLRFCGVSATAPTTRTNGTALQAADEYQNSTDNLRYSWSGTAWVALNSSAQQLETRLASATAGARIVRGAVRSLPSVAELRKEVGNFSGDVVNVTSYHAGWAAFAGHPYPVGGGMKVWDATSTAADNGVTITAVDGVAEGRWFDIDGSVNVNKAGAIPGDPSTQKIAIERADAVAKALNKPLWFGAGMTYYADILNLRSRVVLGKDTKLIKTSSTGLGLINWGDKTTTEGIVDGTLSGFELNGNGKDNVVLCRLYGNHTRSRVCSMRLLDSDFYAISWGGLTSQGDKDDYFDGLELSDIYIASERGNTATSTSYSFGLEIFPGKLCRNMKVRNVVTYGRIINKIHWVDGLDIDHINFKASSIFNSLGSGYCELNNCYNATVGEGAVFDTGDNATYLALLVGGSRVAGGPAVTNFTMAGNVMGRASFERVADMRCTSAFKCTGLLYLYNECGDIFFDACQAATIQTSPGSTGSINKLTVNSMRLGTFRFDVPEIQIREFVANNPIITIRAGQCRLNNVVKATLNAPLFKLNYTNGATFALSVANSACTINNMVLDGGGLFDRPFNILPGGSIKLRRSSFDDMTLAGVPSSNLLWTGSLPLAQSIGNDVNGVAI